jgi:endo-1,4-beta-xylanase
MRFNSVILASVATGSVLVTAQLNQLAQAAGLRYFGTITTSNDQANPDYKPIVNDRKEFGQWTEYFAFGWKDTEATQGKFTFDNGDRAINLALSQKQLMRCSSLVDIGSLPDWCKLA